MSRAFSLVESEKEVQNFECLFSFLKFKCGLIRVRYRRTIYIFFYYWIFVDMLNNYIVRVGVGKGGLAASSHFENNNSKLF